MEEKYFGAHTLRQEKCKRECGSYRGIKHNMSHSISILL